MKAYPILMVNWTILQKRNTLAKNLSKLDLAKSDGGGRGWFGLISSYSIFPTVDPYLICILAKKHPMFFSTPGH